MRLQNLTRAAFADVVRGLCALHSERAETLGREQGWTSAACCELLGLDLFITGGDSRPVRAVRAYLAAGCDARFKGEE